MITCILLLLVVYLFGLLYPEFLIGRMSSFFWVTSIIYIIITSLYLIKYRKKRLFCFELIFGFSFFMSTLALSYILAIIDDWHVRIFVKNDVIQVKTYLICFIGYLSYMLGLILNKKKYRNVPKPYCVLYRFSKHSVKITNVFTLLTILLFYLMGGKALLTIYSNQGPDLSTRLGDWGEFMQYAMCFYTVSILVNFLSEKISKSSIWSFFKSLPMLFYVNSILLVVPLILSGYRSNAVQLIIPMILMYSLVVKKLSFTKIDRKSVV